MTLHKRILDNLSHTVLVLDQRLAVNYINPSGEMLLGVSARQVHGQPVLELLHLDGRFNDSFIKARDGGHPFTEREVEMTLRPDMVLTVDLSITPFSEPTRDMTPLAT